MMSKNYMKRASKLKQEIARSEYKISLALGDFKKALSELPNILAAEVPAGADERRE